MQTILKMAKVCSIGTAKTWGHRVIYTTEPSLSGMPQGLGPAVLHTLPKLDLWQALSHQTGNWLCLWHCCEALECN